MTIAVDAPAVTKAPLVLEPPSGWHLMLKNDDVTPLLFVVELIMYFLKYTEAKATEIANEVHDRGKASAGIFTREIAETRASQFMEEAKAHGYPFVAVIEKAI